MDQEASLAQVDTPMHYVRLTWHDVVTNEGREHVAALPVTLGRAADNTIVLNSGLISREHAVLMASTDGIMLQDRKSSNGTYVGQERITQTVLPGGSGFSIGPFHFIMTVVSTPPAQGTAPVQWTTVDQSAQTILGPLSPITRFLDDEQTVESQSTLLFSHVTNALMPLTPPNSVEDPLPRSFVRQPFVPLREVYRDQGSVAETTYLAVGGGLGSFAWIDHLRIYGVEPEHIAALGPEPSPSGRYQRLAHNSQIPDHERLRSNSESCPDNIWGWPSYGLREIWQSLQQGQFKHGLSIAMQVFGEPVLTDTYTPRAGVVFNAVDREARRINWGQMWHHGWAQALRKTNDGRYVLAYSQINQHSKQEQHFVVARYVHLAMGYPAIQFLPDLQEYRQRTQDIEQVVNAYEGHDHIYNHLFKHGGAVIVRGRGIVASRVIQRLYEVRVQNPQKSITILHVHRSPTPVGHQDRRARRKVKNHTEFQPFNWPKACWTGSMLYELEQANDQQRDQLLNDWGGTTTADRKDWQRIVETGLQEGWYQVYFGQVKLIDRTAQGRLMAHLSTGKPNQPEISLTTDFIIDCTGLELALDSNPLLKDMADCYRLGRNPKGRLRVTNDFEVEGMSNGPGRVYASGSSTLGGPHAAVDSFLGLQYAALRSVENLEALRAPWLQPLTPPRSFSQWTRWCKGVRP